MRITRKTRVLIKTERQFVIRGEATEEDEALGCCECRGQQTMMITARVAADFFELGKREIYRLIEAGKIHFAETEKNEVYVCPASVRQIFDLTE